MLSIYAYGVGGANAVGLAAVGRMAPAALAAPLTSLLGDRHSRRDVLLALALTAVMFALAGAALAGIPRDVREPEPHAEPEERLEEMAAGFRAVAAEPGLRLVVGVLGVSTLVEGAIDVLVVLIALESLDLGAAGVGWLNSAWGLGGIVGGALAVLVLGRRATHPGSCWRAC